MAKELSFFGVIDAIGSMMIPMEKLFLAMRVKPPAKSGQLYRDVPRFA